jgi:hypothetical protein
MRKHLIPAEHTLTLSLEIRGLLTKANAQASEEVS